MASPCGGPCARLNPGVSIVNPVSLFGEFKRRRVFRALIGYGIAAFAVLQIIEPVMHGLHWSDEVLSYVVVALAVGFPIVVSLAWIFDVNAGRIERTAPASTGGPRGVRLGLLLVGIGVLAAAPGVVWYFMVRSPARPVPSSVPATAAATPSIAVLPFADMSPGKDQEYFSDGIAEEILNALAQVDGLRVIGRTSSFSFKGKTEDLRAIGEKLGVAHVLEGSVRKEGNRLRITAQLIEAAGGSHLWSKTFDREMKGIFAVQDEIARDVVEVLKVKLLRGNHDALRARRATSPESYAYFLLGNQLVQGADLPHAIEAYKKALDLDRNYAPAWAAMAITIAGVTLEAETPAAVAEGSKRALEAAEKAIELAPELPDGFESRSAIRVSLWYWEGAMSDAERALALAPNHGDAYRRQAQLLLFLGRPAAATLPMTKATEIDPLNRLNWLWLGDIYLFSGEIALGRSAYERAIRLTGRDTDDTIWGMVASFVREAKYDEALKWMRKLKDEKSRERWTAEIEHFLGHAQEARRALDELVAKHGDPVVIAGTYALFGERDRAFTWLDKAYAERRPELRWLKVARAWANLHGDPRYIAVLKKMNLPVD